jgi:hypothetical protein
LWALSGGNQNACQTKALTGQWQQLQATITMPAATSTLRAQVYIPAGVNIDFDGGDLGAPQTADAVYNPIATAKPTVTGSTTVGSALTCSNGSWEGDPDQPTSYSFAWLRDGAAINGADSPTYATSQADVGHALGCSITATNAAGGATATSSAVGPMTPAAGSGNGSGLATPAAGSGSGSGSMTPAAGSGSGSGLATPAAGSGSGSGSMTPAAGSASPSGSGSAADPFAEPPVVCTVPTLKHMTLSQAEHALHRAHCRVGKVHRPRQVTRHRVLRVLSQSARARSKHIADYLVGITLG